MDALTKALELLSQCAGQLQRTGGMMNKDLAREVTKFVAETKKASVADADPKVGA